MKCKQSNYKDRKLIEKWKAMTEMFVYNILDVDLLSFLSASGVIRNWRCGSDVKMAKINVSPRKFYRIYKDRIC